MSITVIVAVDPLAKLPLNSYIDVSVFGVQSPARFQIDKAGTFETQTLPLPLPNVTLPKPGSLPVIIEASAHSEHRPIRLESIVPAGGARFTFHVLPGGPEDSRFSIEGDVLHPRTATPTCSVRCLPNGAPKGPGECVECENDDAIVRLCC
jgi:hypothetical protein